MLMYEVLSAYILIHGSAHIHRYMKYNIAYRLGTKLIYVDQCLAIWTRPTYLLFCAREKIIMQLFLDECGPCFISKANSRVMRV